MNAAALRRIWGMMYRHLALFRRSWPRLLELAYWPVLQMCIWGFTASYLAGRMGSPVAVAAATLLGGVLLWEVALRSQMGVAISFLEELWSRNLGHVFVSPLRPWELVAALILRHGAGAEALAWSVLFGLTPFSAVFYPVSVLPVWVRPIALALPSAHVFEGMRGVLLNGVIRWDHLAWAFGLNALWLAAAIAVFAQQFRQARVRGALLSIGE